MNKLFFLIPNILSKLLFFLSYYKLYGSGIVNSIYENIYGEIYIIEEEISNKDQIELELIEGKSSKLAMIHDISNKNKFKYSNDKLSIYLKTHAKYLEIATNTGIAITILCSLI